MTTSARRLSEARGKCEEARGKGSNDG